jgi:hypothetical protein
MIGPIVFLFVVCVYFLPALFAMERRHSKEGSIFVINLFLGWTFIGWIIALSWALSEDNRK